MNLTIIILAIIIGFIVIGLFIEWLINATKRFLEKEVGITLGVIRREEEHRQSLEKTITLIDLKTYYDLVKKITGKELEVLEMTRHNFEWYKNLLDFRGFVWLSRTDEDWVYKNAKIRVIDE